VDIIFKRPSNKKFIYQSLSCGLNVTILHAGVYWILHNTYAMCDVMFLGQLFY